MTTFTATYFMYGDQPSQNTVISMLVGAIDFFDLIKNINFEFFYDDSKQWGLKQLLSPLSQILSQSLKKT